MNNIAELFTSSQILKQITGKVLLINPPVIDSRYPWVSWNQPLELLKLSMYLAQNNECETKLFDFMLPLPSGVVPRSQSKIDDVLPPGEQVKWYYGQSSKNLDIYLDKLVRSKWIPQYVWISTLTSFWWQTIPIVAGIVKNKLKDPIIVLGGNYAFLETEHALHFCPNIDIVVKELVNLGETSSNFSLYKDQKPKFRALDLRCPKTANEIADSLQMGISHFVFFNENIFSDFENTLKPVLEEVKKRKWKLYFHGICGIETKDFPIEYTDLLIDAHFNEFHFEAHLNSDGSLDEACYKKIMLSLEKRGIVSRRGGGWESKSHYISGFMWVGKPKDDIDLIVWNALKIQQIVGMVIPKPYTPLPHSEDYMLLRQNCDWIEPEDISPHRLPFSKFNSIPRSDYQDIYRLTALLNNKVRGQTFDFLGDTSLAKVIKSSLIGQRWNI
jgi:hypothetical protein